MKSLQTEILATHTSALFREAVSRAAELLRRGEVVALPTETVYGLAANAFNVPAVERIFAIKGRPAHNPVIVHVASREMARQCVSYWPKIAAQLAASFWPGPLTLVLPRAEAIPDIVTAGGPTVGVRWPSHPFIQAVIRECGFPLAAPSANLSTSVSPTTAAHVNKGLGGKIGLIVDGGQCQVGIESTVLDLTATPPRVLRPGIIHRESLAAAMANGEFTADAAEDERERNRSAEPLRSPGRLPKHYSPKAKLEVFSWRDERELKSRIEGFAQRSDSVHVIAHTVIPASAVCGRVSVVPHDPEAFARALYAELHQCDEAGAARIIVEAVPDTREWRAIIDRLKRAAN